MDKITLLIATGLVGFAFTLVAEEPATQITIGNAELNWIVTDGSKFTFPEVRINGNGWLVMHPFAGGKPNGDIYVCATYVSDGTSQDVGITVDDNPMASDMYIVMLHRDVNEDQIFDFVFVGETGMVEDAAVFEGSLMIGHAYSSP